MLSPSKRTRVALTEVLIPGPHDQFPILSHDLNQLAERSGIVAIILGHRNLGKKPEFGFSLVFLDVDVNRLAR
ncbi:hypothetical protein HDF16_001256 [Granulicella aggregans]|uniref:Uncharacterized protein n=1 Tax=Granulicella aggregans TaxID=474949 RepID=A0A7W7ZAZ5_9BACT|nr:hypothetical protein [Granulicella aggregans]